jgi:hypothetical protein
MNLQEAFEPIEEMNRAVVMADTWGHLAPKPNTKYPGFIVFCHSEYGDITPIRVDFPNLPDSPWFFDDLIDFISNRVCSRGTVHLPEGEVYLFTGTYTKFQNGNYRFSGKIKKITPKF